MRRSTRFKTKPLPPNSDSEEEIASTKKTDEETSLKQVNLSESSSDESDIEQYLKPASKLDLNSSFFNLQKGTEPTPSFDNIEKNILNGVRRLSDSDSDDVFEDNASTSIDSKSTFHTILQSQPSTSNFQELKEYKERIEEAKKHAEKYVATKKALDTTQDISNLLALGEGKVVEPDLSLHSSDFESCDSEKEDWEEIKTKDNEDKSLIPSTGVEIVVDMPTAVRKKKKTDLLAAMKRRLNRIRKENQVYVHKVHLLSWIAHGLYVNSCINNPQILAMALSLLPSEQCYPNERCDLKYLEGILKWYKRTVKYAPNNNSKNLVLDKSLLLQINKKEAFTNKALVIIFIAILRSLGIPCRLVLSFVVEPLRPPNSELHSLSTKQNEKQSNTQLKKENKKESTDNKRVAENGNNNVESKKLKIPQNEKVLNKNETSPSKNNLQTKVESKEKKNSIKKSAVDHKKDEIKKETKTSTKNKSNDKPSLSRIKKIANTEQKSSTNKNVSTGDKTKNETNKSEKNKPNLKKIQKTETSNSQSKSKNELIKVKLQFKTRSRSTQEEATSSQPKTENTKKQSLNKPDLTKLRRSSRKKSPSIPQTDGNHDNSSDESNYIPQLDGANDEKAIKSRSRKSTSSIATTQESTNPKRSLRTRSNQVKSLADNNSEDEFRSRSPLTVKNRLSNGSSIKNKPNLKSLTSPSRSETKGSGLDVRNDIVNLIKGRISEAKQEDRQRKIKKRKSVKEDDSSDSDFLIEEPKKKPKTRKVLSSDSESEGKKNKINVWAEVFLEMEEKWISVDVVHGQIHCVKELHARATHPVAYIVAFNNDNSIKDITARYCQNFNTVTRKLRVDAKWWTETLNPFQGPKNAREKEEDDELARQQLEKPLPKSITEYKNHPLYVLKRHLLKFEAIYPPDAVTLGFVRGEPVYSRNCVYTLHSRDIWLKHAKVVKLGEKPYKIVKARPKYDKLSNSVITDQMLEIFGPWQVEDYVPPTAENGIVPRNAFGNVELFKPCMLPKKTVHLQLPGLNKIAKRMNIDCASAIVGFDFHGGWSHPTYDGFVVCEEFKDILIAAWDLEQEENERKEQEKLESRVYGNWKKLIKGLLIRERLKARYDFGNPNENVQKKKPKGIKFCTKKR